MPFCGLPGRLRLLDGHQAVLFGRLIVRGRQVMEGLHGGLDSHGGRRAGQDLGRRAVVGGMAAGYRVLDDPDGHGRGLRVAVDGVGFLVPDQVRVVQWYVVKLSGHLRPPLAGSSGMR